MSVVERAVKDGLGADVRDEVGFFGVGVDRLFGCRSQPMSGASSGVVICPPLAAERVANYGREVALSRALTRLGVAVQRFDYRGTGNSDGESSDLTFETMVEDAALAAASLHEIGVDCIGFLGSRLGALTASSAAAAFPGAPLVLWEPALQADRWFAEALRAAQMQDLRSKANRVSPSDLVERLALGGSIEVAGYRIDGALHRSCAGRSLLGELGDDARSLLVVQYGPHRDVRADVAAQAEVLRRTGFDVAVETFEGPPSWWFPGTTLPRSEHLVRTTAVWLERQMTAVRT